MGKFKAPIRISEDAIAECRDNLLAELIVTKNVTIDNTKITTQDMLDDIESEDKDNVFEILLGNAVEAKAEADRVITAAFNSEVSDNNIINHLIEKEKDLALERHLEGECEHEH